MSRSSNCWPPSNSGKPRSRRSPKETAEVWCLMAVDVDRTVHGITSWLPEHQEGAVVTLCAR